MGYILEAVMLLFCLSCTIVMMILVGPSLGKGDSGEESRLTVWTLFGITVLMALVAFRKIVGRFIVAASYTEIRALDNNSVFGMNAATATNAAGYQPVTDEVNDNDDNVIIIAGEESDESVADNSVIDRDLRGGGGSEGDSSSDLGNLSTIGVRYTEEI
jgi:hypothetical protein